MAHNSNKAWFIGVTIVIALLLSLCKDSKAENNLFSFFNELDDQMFSFKNCIQDIPPSCPCNSPGKGITSIRFDYRHFCYLDSLISTNPSLCLLDSILILLNQNTEDWEFDSVACGGCITPEKHLIRPLSTTFSGIFIFIYLYRDTASDRKVIEFFSSHQAVTEAVFQPYSNRLIKLNWWFESRPLQKEWNNLILSTKVSKQMICLLNPFQETNGKRLKPETQTREGCDKFLDSLRIRLLQSCGKTE